MTKQRRLISAGASLGLAIAVFATGCDSGTTGSGHTPQPTTSSPSPAPTEIVKSAVTITIRPPTTKLIAGQQELLAAFREYINCAVPIPVTSLDR